MLDRIPECFQPRQPVPGLPNAVSQWYSRLDLTGFVEIALTLDDSDVEEAMTAIRKEFPEAKIIILTTYTGDAENAKKLGARAYLLKANLDKELLGTIRAVHTAE